MTAQIVLRPPHSYKSPRRQPFLGNHDISSRGGSRMGEVFGGTAAECTAVCCCCPCVLVELVVMAVYKLPAGLCRRALWGKRRGGHRSGSKKAMLPCRYSFDTADMAELRRLSGPLAAVMAMSADKDVAELEKEMWDRFYGAGFWRSPSQKSVMADFSVKI